MNTEVRKMEISLIRIMNLVRRFSGHEEVNKMMDSIQRAIMLLRQMQIAIRATQAAISASGPVGWIYAGITVVSTLITTATMVQEMG